MLIPLLMAAVLDPAIIEIQEALSKIDGPKGYYSTTYSKEESKYWSNLPDWMKEDARKRKVARVLDVGCGYGTLLAYSAKTYGAKGFCLDTTEYLWPAFRNPRGLTFAKGNIELDPIPWKEPFDLMVMTEVLEHFNFRPIPTLSKIRASLADGGVVFLSTPDAESSWGRITKYYPSLDSLPALDTTATWIDGHIWQYSQSELERVLAQAGFGIRALERVNGAQGKHFNVWAVKR